MKTATSIKPLLLVDLGHNNSVDKQIYGRLMDLTGELGTTIEGYEKHFSPISSGELIIIIIVLRARCVSYNNLQLVHTVYCIMFILFRKLFSKIKSNDNFQ